MLFLQMIIYMQVVILFIEKPCKKGGIVDFFFQPMTASEIDVDTKCCALFVT